MLPFDVRSGGVTGSGVWDLDVRSTTSRLDNTRSERALRSMVVGRKTRMFSGTHTHTEPAAQILSILTPWRHRQIDDQTYIEQFMRALLTWPRDCCVQFAPVNSAKTHELLDANELDFLMPNITAPGCPHPSLLETRHSPPALLARAVARPRGQRPAAGARRATMGNPRRHGATAAATPTAPPQVRRADGDHVARTVRRGHPQIP